MSEGNADGWLGPNPHPSLKDFGVVPWPEAKSRSDLFAKVVVDYPDIDWRFFPAAEGQIAMVGEISRVVQGGRKVKVSAGRTMLYLESNERFVEAMRQIGEMLYGKLEDHGG